MFKAQPKSTQRDLTAPNTRRYARFVGTATAVMIAGSAAAADLDRPLVMAPSLTAPTLYNWTGFFAGGDLGYNYGKTNFSTATLANPGTIIDGGSQSLRQKIDSYNESGSFFVGAQAGFNYMFANRIVVGGVADFNANTFPSYNNLSTGGVSTILGGSETFSDNILDSGTFRGRIGYAPGNWLIYATGGLAWAYDERTITFSDGDSASSFRGRLGYAVGAGIEAPLIPHWTAFLEFMYNKYGSTSNSYQLAGQKFTSDSSTEQVKFGLNYQFADDGKSPSSQNVILPKIFNEDRINIHEDFSGIYQGYPSFASPAFNGPKTFRSNGEAREVVSLDLFIGAKLWDGAEFWFNPEIDQGFGVSNSTGLAGFLNNGAFKLGQAAPYARVEDYFIRQTFNFGGTTTDAPAGEVNFATTQSSNRLVITAGRLSQFTLIGASTYFDVKGGLSNWNFGFPLSYDFGSDFWGSTFGALGEYYYGPFVARLGIFQMTKEPFDSQLYAGQSLNPSFFNDFNTTAELEYNYTALGQPGKVKATGWLVHGYFADINTALSNAAASGTTPIFDNSRQTSTKPGFLVTAEQHITKDIGIFALYGQESGRYEPYDGDDSDEYIAAGIQIAGTKWGRPNDVFSVAGAIDNISSEYIKFLAAGGTGLEIANGSLPVFGREQVLETYYKFQVTDTVSLTFDYQHLTNPGYNAERGPVNAFLGRARFFY